MSATALPLYLGAGHVESAAGQMPSHPETPQTWVVQNCEDHGDGSLRDIIENPSKAKSGDVIDLTFVPELCGAMNARITLGTGEITVVQDTLTLHGPAVADGTLTVSAQNASRVFQHTGVGTLYLADLTITQGEYHAVGSAYGGCIRSAGSVALQSSVVSNCTALSDTQYARGGGVFATDNVTLSLSAITGNQSSAPAHRGFGGGLAADNLTSTYSSLSANTAHDGAVFGGVGGAAYVQSGVTIFGSTIDHNSASSDSAILFKNGIISNSTVSNNTASQSAALESFGGDSVVIANSTIAFNHAGVTYGAVFFEGASATSTLVLQSSIIANNTAASNVPSDLYVPPGLGSITGANNLIIAANVTPPAGVITVVSDPMLGPLQFNGGPTMTHVLLQGSPAVGAGNNNNASPTGNDQRGTGYPRTSGTAASVDIGAVQFDSIFAGSFD